MRYFSASFFPPAANPNEQRHNIQHSVPMLTLFV